MHSQVEPNQPNYINEGTTCCAESEISLPLKQRLVNETWYALLMTSKFMALAFLIAGPVTTLPAMSAVWGIVSRKVFLLYLVIPFTGAILFGWMYAVFQ